MEISYTNEFIFLLFTFITWLFMLSECKDRPIYSIIQLLIGIPLSSYMLYLAFYSDMIYGYLVGISILTLSGLIAFLELKR